MEPFFKSGFTFATSRKREAHRESIKLRIGLAKISTPSFRNLLNRLLMPATLGGFKPFKTFNIFPRDIA